MGVVMKFFLTLFVLVVLAIVVAGLYVAVATGALNVPFLSFLQGEASPPPAALVEEGRRVEGKIDQELADKSAFRLDLSDSELNALVAVQLANQTQVQDVRVTVEPGGLRFEGNLTGRIPIPFSGRLSTTIQAGGLSLSLDEIVIGVVPLPGGFSRMVDPVLNQVLNLNQVLAQAGAASIQEVRTQKGGVTIIGVQARGKIVTDEALKIIESARRGQPPSPRPAPPPGADLVPVAAAPAAAGQRLFLAVGDSLSAGVGATQPSAAYAPRIAAYLAKRTAGTGYINLGVSGENSGSFIRNGQLQRALSELRRPNIQGAVVSLSLGANDLLGHLGSATCQNEPTGPACQERFNAAIATFRDNLDPILRDIRGAAGPQATIVLLTVYNPLNFGTGLGFEREAETVLARLNDAIRAGAARYGMAVADAHAAMGANAAAWTHMLQGDVHPTDEGYQAIAFSIAQAVQ